MPDCIRSWRKLSDMMDLDDRRLGILEKMGIDIWYLRENSRAPLPDREEEILFPHGVEKAEVQTGCLDRLAKSITGCQKCPLHETRTHAVPGVGSPTADWMFVGEAPGQNEDRQGLPFVGRAGQLLDEMIAALKMQRKDVFIANVIKCRPPGNRDPLPAEVDQCEPYLHQQLSLIKPKIIVALGRVSAQALLKTAEPISKLRGRVHRYGEWNTPLIPTYHPAYLLRSPGQKGKAWEDLLLAKSVVAGR